MRWLVACGLASDQPRARLRRATARLHPCAQIRLAATSAVDVTIAKARISAVSPADKWRQDACNDASVPSRRPVSGT
jgi:hypothetical protein